MDVTADTLPFSNAGDASTLIGAGFRASGCRYAARYRAELVQTWRRDLCMGGYSLGTQDFIDERVGDWHQLNRRTQLPTRTNRRGGSLTGVRMLSWEQVAKGESYFRRT